ncbi:hypothetical protein KCP75_09665 [Salmonella enterica subsp. enterica]|nr:hypothetical protein KCP75_09665 [Salmonella enterica subsp. enterica]
MEILRCLKARRGISTFGGLRVLRIGDEVPREMAKNTSASPCSGGARQSYCTDR